MELTIINNSSDKEEHGDTRRKTPGGIWPTEAPDWLLTQPVLRSPGKSKKKKKMGGQALVEYILQ